MARPTHGASATILAIVWSLAGCAADSVDGHPLGDGDGDSDGDTDTDADADGDADGDGDGWQCPLLGESACDVAEVTAGGYYPWQIPLPSTPSAGHTCARLVSGEIACWGANGAGQLGFETTELTGHPTPGRVPGLLGPATQVSAGGAHTCMLREGSVDCWGANEVGQLGDGTTVDRTAPAPADAVLGAQSVRAGARFTCVTRLDGQVACWGEGGRGQLGVDLGAGDRCGDEPCSTVPILVPGLDQIVEVALGETHACARDAVGAVWCWGSNGSGELGDGTFEDRAEPRRVPGLTPVAQVAAGGNMTCALTQQGHVSCWGALYFDRFEGLDPDPCADGESEPFPDPWPCATTPRPVDPNDDDGDGVSVDDATAIAVGKEHGCALVGSGGVRCWGGNRAGQLGDGMLVARDASREVTGIFEAQGIAAGRLHTCAWRSDAVFCWGDDEFSQVGIAPGDAAHTCLSRVETEYPCQAVPVRVEGVPPAHDSPDVE